MQHFRDGVGWLRIYVSLVSLLFREVCDPQMFVKIPIFFTLLEYIYIYINRRRSHFTD